MSLDKSDLERWLEHPITRLLHNKLIELDESLKEYLLNPGVVLAPQGQISYATASGQRELIERVLNIAIEDLIETEETEEDD